MTISLVGFAVLLGLIFFGVPLGFALILVGLVGFAIVRADMVGQALMTWGDAGLALNARAVNGALVMAGQQMYDQVTNYGLTVIPLFVLMGAFIHRSQLAQELYDAANAFVGHRRGGLAMGTIAACGGFGAVCGSSIATAATICRVAMPSMRRFGYADSLSTGAIAAGGTLGIMIPPSVPMVIYGLLSETDIAKLFIAGVLPGLLLIVLFFGTIAVMTALNPEAGPRGARVPWGERWGLVARVWGVVVIFVVIIGGIYAGIFTPTEAAGIGVAAAALFAWARGKLGWTELRESLVETGITTGMIFVVAFGAVIFSNFVNLAGFTRAISDWLVGLNAPPLGVVVAICVVYLIMGCVFDSLAMLILTVPIFAAILKPMGVDMVWFGIVAVIAVELGLITPPIGINVFVVKSAVPDVNIWTVFRGVWPFVLAMLAALIIVLLVPQTATFLPGLMAR
ncbi:TRAP transporter, DctM subunit [Gemmobacter megaterium]|uniref:TRAP transporter large permease protein n=1 Tax=Gemmobacter megaterium TaxID=1086013 RepID=A0A1N7QNC0_9RHOB|nr:TRAP transporter large permease [Gemmobacter megaterium]GGE27729.1 C4-dicarboxylate ABC transporter permease [Gemmobacter megaterium]SIT24264.1 TRAP transporter, DctM subunit [Gemmobacter megaterium]